MTCSTSELNIYRETMVVYFNHNFTWMYLELLRVCNHCLHDYKGFNCISFLTGLYSAPKYWIWYTSICMSGPHQKKHRENWRIHDFPEIMRNKGSNESFSLTSISFEMIRACLWNKHLLKCSSASSQMTAASIPFTYHVSSHIRALK